MQVHLCLDTCLCSVVCACICVWGGVGSKVDRDIFLSLTLAIGAGPLTTLSFLGSASLASHCSRDLCLCILSAVIMGICYISLAFWTITTSNSDLNIFSLWVLWESQRNVSGIIFQKYL